METTIMTAGALGLGAVAVAVVAIVRAWRLQATTKRLLQRAVPRRWSNPWKANKWFDADPLLFVGGETAPVDCGPGADPTAVGCH